MVPVLPDLGESLDCRLVAFDHEEGEHARGRARHPHQAVDQHPTATLCKASLRSINFELLILLLQRMAF